MPRRKIGKENTRNIQRTRGMYHISIPIEIMRDLEWREKQKVVVRRHGDKVVIEDWNKNSKQ